MVTENWTSSGAVVSSNSTLIVSSGEAYISTTVKPSGRLRVRAGGYVESTILNNATASNAGSAVDTFLSGGVMQLLNGGIAENVQVLRNARLTVSSGAVATNVTVAAGGSGNVNATVYGNDSVTRIDGTNERGNFFLSGGTASNFLLFSLGVLTVSSGGTALDTEIRANGALTVSNGGVATGIVLSKGGKLNTTVRGNDAQTLVSGSHASGTFLLSGGVASDFILYENATQYVSSGGTALHTLISSSWAHQSIFAGGLASLTSVCSKGSMTILGGGIARDTVISSGGTMMAAGGSVSGATVMSGGSLQVTTATAGPDESGGSSVLENIFVVSGGTLDAAANAKYSGTVDISGTLKISSGVEIGTLTVSSGGSAVVGGTLRVATSTWNTTVNKNGLMVVSSGGIGYGVTVSDGGRLTVSAGGSATDIVQKEGGRINAFVGGADTTALLAGVNDSGSFLLSGGSVSGFIVYSGAVMIVSDGGVATDTEIRSGGRLDIHSGAEINGRLHLDFADSPNSVGLISDLSSIDPDEVEITLTGMAAAGTYVIADEGSPDAYVNCVPTGMCHEILYAGESCADVFGGMKYSFDDDGRAMITAALDETEQPPRLNTPLTLNSAGSGAEISDYDYAAVWTNFTATSGAVLNIVDENLAMRGNAWLELDRTGLSGTTLFGATLDESYLFFEGNINLKATSGATIGNLAAGANTSGAVVGNVRLILDSATVAGAGYAGGFGAVDGKTETLIADCTFNKDFYAGALANYAKTDKTTRIGDVTLTVANGVFDGNLYGASAVKVGTKSVQDAHTAGHVDISISGGEAANGNFCLFAGGYATGSNNKQYSVYHVEGVSLSISGGTWCGETVPGGRGIFGGIFASGVWAGTDKQDVDITISGGTFGNVFGGGWAQKNGRSSVGDVNISISGGTIAYVFGGGSTSISGGSTSAEDVTITVSGGNITGAIYARGQTENDAVNGTATVVFTGKKDYGCDVYGYTCVGDEDPSSATLVFSKYTGTFSGTVGGFASVKLDGGTTLTLGNEASVSNTAWEFDLRESDNISALIWSAADFTENTFDVKFASYTQAHKENNIAKVATNTSFTGATFDLTVGDDVIATGLAYGTKISGGDYDGWGFALDGSLLKFKQLA